MSETNFNLITKQFDTLPDPEFFRAGSRFFRPASPGLDGGIFKIVCSCKGSPKGEAMLINEQTGWNYTGEVFIVENTQKITKEEFEKITGGHQDNFLFIDQYKK